MKDRRGKLEIYHDMLSAIIDESQNNDKILPTRIQFKSNLSYDKLQLFLKEMEHKNLLIKDGTMKITDSGMEFFRDYTVIKDMISKMCNKVFMEV